MQEFKVGQVYDCTKLKENFNTIKVTKIDGDRIHYISLDSVPVKDRFDKGSYMATIATLVTDTPSPIPVDYAAMHVVHIPDSAAYNVMLPTYEGAVEYADATVLKLKCKALICRPVVLVEMPTTTKTVLTQKEIL